MAATGTRQACLFRDAYSELTSASGLAIYGLSSDSPKANTAFKDKQKLPYPLLCDPQASLIGAIGLKKAPKGTTRGVFVVDKSGKVLAAQAGGPEATVNVVKEIVEGLSGGGAAAEKAEEAVDAAKEAEEEKEKEAEEKGEEKPADVAPEGANGESKDEEDKAEEKAEEKKE